MSEPAEIHGLRTALGDTGRALDNALDIIRHLLTRLDAAKMRIRELEGAPPAPTPLLDPQSVDTLGPDSPGP